MGTKDHGQDPRGLAAALAFVSQGIHLWVLPGQLAAAMLPGVFFFLVAVGQGLLGASLLFGGGRWTARFGVLLNVFVVLVWLLTRGQLPPTLRARQATGGGARGRRDVYRGRARGLADEAGSISASEKEARTRLANQTLRFKR
jgi:hypothetical protein